MIEWSSDSPKDDFIQQWRGFPRLINAFTSVRGIRSLKASPSLPCKQTNVRTVADSQNLEAKLKLRSRLARRAMVPRDDMPRSSQAPHRRQHLGLPLDAHDAPRGSHRRRTGVGVSSSSCASASWVSRTRLGRHRRRGSRIGVHAPGSLVDARVSSAVRTGVRTMATAFAAQRLRRRIDGRDGRDGGAGGDCAIGVTVTFY